MPIKLGRDQLRAVLVLGLLTIGSSGTWAQSFSCTTASGVRYLSKAPCPVGSKPPGITYHGPRPSQPSFRNPTTVAVPRASEELTYMGSKCASMQEAIRTAPARGINAITVRDLRRNFDLECQDERQRALQRLATDKRESRQLADEKFKAGQQQKLDAKQAEQKLMDQCAEMRRSLHQRKQRQATSEGEARDLALFEERYTLRCVQAASR